MPLTPQPLIGVTRRLLDFVIAERDAFYLAVRVPTGGVPDDDDRESLGQMDSLINEAEALLLAYRTQIPSFVVGTRSVIDVLEAPKRYAYSTHKVQRPTVWARLLKRLRRWNARRAFNPDMPPMWRPQA